MIDIDIPVAPARIANSILELLPDSKDTLECILITIDNIPESGDAYTTMTRE